MTAAVYRSVTPSLSVPQTQNTAPVLEFNCLYTHDLRRKQKRWQDGFLRFHTFNKRIMVYDIPRNFIGDAHWKTSDVLQDGDEVTLEKGGVLVQVAENVGRTETDLTELMNSKKNKKASHQVSSPIARSAVATARTPAPAGSRLTAQSKHRSLNALLGTPKGPLGKATLPSQSPFDQRRVEQENLDWEDGRSAKRLRIEQPAWTVSRTTKAAGAQRAIKPPPLWARTNDAHSKKRIQSAPIRGQQQLGTKEIIDLREDDDGPGSDQFLAGFSSDALVMPSSPPRPPAKERPTVEPLRQIVRSSSPAFRTQQPSVNADTHRREARLLTERTSDATAKQIRPTKPSGMQLAMQQDPLAHDRLEREFQVTDIAYETEVTPSNAAATVQPSNTKAKRTLRIAASAPKKKGLLCQNQLSQPTKRRPESLGLSVTLPAEEVIAAGRASEQRHKTQRAQLDDRLARIDAKEQQPDPSDPFRRKPKLLVQSDRSMVDSKAGGDHQPQTPAAQTVVTPTDFDHAALFPNESPNLPPPRPPPISPAAHNARQLRRVTSESGTTSTQKPKRALGAPVRITPSPAKRFATSASPTIDTFPTRGLEKGNAGPATRTKGRKPLQRAVSLNVASGGTSIVILSRPFQAPKAPAAKLPLPPPVEPEPWSREAFDLFAWRPPGWDEERWCLKAEGGVAVAEI